MKTNTTTPNYKGFRFPQFRDIEELLDQRGIVVTYETVRQWCLKFGQMYANELRRHRPRCGNKWHLDEVFLKINRRTHSLWRAVDQDGNVLDIRVAKPPQQARNQAIFPQTAEVGFNTSHA